MTQKHLTKTRRNHELWDKRINEQWNGARPILSPEESLLAAQKLYRHAMGKPWRGKWAIVTGNRHTWVRSGTFNVNPDRRWGERGLRGIIHMIAHYCHRRLHPEDKPHSIRQMRLEAKLTKFAIDRRWHEGTLKEKAKPLPKKLPRAERVKKLQLAQLRLRRRRAEFERAQRLLAKAAKDCRELSASLY